MKRQTAVALALACLLGATEAKAQTLTIRNDHFEVDGVPRFLTFISYFDAMRRANAGGGTSGLAADFAFFQGKVDGVRILVNWCNYPSSCAQATDTLFDSSGVIRDSGSWSTLNPWQRFIAVLDAAKTYGLIVNVTFSRETISTGSPISASTYATGIYRVIKKLEDDYPGQYRNVFFDMQNEWDHQGHSDGDLQSYVAAANSARSDVIVTGSYTGTASNAVSSAVADGFDILAFHDERVSGWQTYSAISTDVGTIRAYPTSMPIVYDEPTAYCSGNVPYTCRTEDDSDLSHFVDAAKNAKKSGIAAWTFHTRQGFDLASSDYVTKASTNEKNNLASIRDGTRGRSWGVEFTDPTLTGQLVKPIHINELRARINELRARFSLGAYSFTDSTLVPQTTVIKKAHVQDLRDALDQAYVASGRSAPTYDDPITVAVTQIKASHLTELRTLVQALEAAEP